MVREDSLQRSTLRDYDEEIDEESCQKCNFDIFDIVQIFVIILHIMINPYPQVEAAFITDNVNDFLKYGFNFSGECFSKNCYEEQEFSFVNCPGPVERSFIPALILSLLTYPFHFVKVTLMNSSPIHSLYFARIVLGMMMFTSLKYIKNTIRKELKSEATAKCFSILILAQFTILYDGSHFYYNTWAMILTNFAYAFWMQNRWHLTISTLACASIIFRCDTIVFAFALIAIDLVRLRLPIMKCLIWGSISSVIFIAVTVLIDSHIWGIWIWPEFQVFHFNTILNLSSHWGVDPWYTYFVKVLPLNITIAYPLAIFAIFYKRKGSLVDWKVLDLLFPALLFVGLYSLLPHKEYRFILAAYPIFNVCAAIGMEKIVNEDSWCKKMKKISFKVLILMIYAGIFYTLIASFIFPLRLQGSPSLLDLNAEVFNESKDLHILNKPNILYDETLTFQGVPLFLYENTRFGWRYSKTDHMEDEDLLSFTHILTKVPKIDGFHLYKTYPFTTMFKQTCNKCK